MLDHWLLPNSHNNLGPLKCFIRSLCQCPSIQRQSRSKHCVWELFAWMFLTWSDTYEGPLVALKVSVPWDSKEWEIIIVLSFLEDLLRTIHYSGCFMYVISLVILKEHFYRVDRNSMALILHKRKLRLGRGWIPCPESHTWLASESCSAAHPGLCGKAWAPALLWTCFSDS